ncbi:MAG: hypothetical protein RMJ34_07550, partial [candidate division WOR-3 bacterium]|nr:hypothetical protein [candidate division WOR-3 bacterium]
FINNISIFVIFVTPSFLNAKNKSIAVLGEGPTVILPDGTIVLCPKRAPIVCAIIIVESTENNNFPETVSEAEVHVKENNKKYWATFLKPLPTNISQINGSDLKISELIPLEE